MNRVSFFATILLLAFTSCSAPKNVVGIYSYESNSTHSVHQLSLNQDSTFHYSVIGDLSNQTSFGSWSIVNDGKYLVLESDESTRPGVIDVNSRNGGFEKELNLKVVDSSSQPLALATIVLNEESDLGYALDEEGILSINPKVRVELIQVVYLGELYWLKDIEYEKGSQINITIRLKDDTSVYLKNSRWKMRGKNLINLESDIKLIWAKGT